MRLSKEYKALILSSLFDLGENDATTFSNLFANGVDMDKFFELVEIHLLPHILYKHVHIDKKIEETLLPSACAKSLKTTYALTLMRNTQMYKEAARIAAAFEEQGIKLVFLKGTTLGKRLYKDIGLRGFGDFDVLVACDDVEKSKMLLYELGYRPEKDGSQDVDSYDWSKHPHEEPMIKKGSNPIVPGYCVEIHRPRAYYGIDLQKMLFDSEPVDCSFGTILGLSEVDEGISLLAHIYQHLIVQFSYVRVPLRMFSEAREFLKRVWLKYGFKKFSARVQEVTANVPVYVSLVFMNWIYPDTVPSVFLEELRPRENLLYQHPQTYGTGVAIPVSFQQMLLIDRISFVEDDWRLNGVSFAENVTRILIDPESQLSEAMVFEEMWKKRADKHVLLLKTTPDALRLERGSPVLSKATWEAIPSCFLPEAIDFHYFGGNVQFSISPDEIGSLKAEVKLAWNHEYLFVFAKVDDSELVIRDGGLCDGITLSFDIGDRMLQYGLFLSPKENEVQVFRALEAHEWQLLDNTESVTFCEKHFGQGYGLEAAIPWHELQLVPKASEEIRFDIEVVDFRTESVNPHTILVWSGGGGIGWQCRGVFGTMVLTDEVVSCAGTCQLKSG